MAGSGRRHRDLGRNGPAFITALARAVDRAPGRDGVGGDGRHLPVAATGRRGKYLLVFDPLDGSSNIDANISVGTIFSILRSPDPGAEPRAGHFLQPGAAQVCAGFALYGPSTMLILTTGDGVDGFTLDRDIGAFVLTHPQLRLHQRVPLIFGSRNEVDRIERYHRGQATAQEPAIGDSLFSSRSLFRSP